MRIGGAGVRNILHSQERSGPRALTKPSMTGVQRVVQVYAGEHGEDIGVQHGDHEFEGAGRFGKHGQLAESFIMTRPETIRVAAAMRIGVSASPSTVTPTMKAPTAPMPVQIV